MANSWSWSQTSWTLYYEHLSGKISASLAVVAVDPVDRTVTLEGSIQVTNFNNNLPSMTFSVDSYFSYNRGSGHTAYGPNSGSTISNSNGTHNSGTIRFTIQYSASSEYGVTLTDVKPNLHFACNATHWYYYGDTKSCVLPAIPSDLPTVTLSASSVNFGSSVNIVTQDPNSVTLKYDIEYSFGGSSGTVGSNLSAGTKAWTVANALMSEIPNETSGVIAIIVTSKNADGYVYSTHRLSLTANVPASIKPSISALTVSEAATIPSALSGLYVQSKSKFSVSGTAAGSNGSTIQLYSTTIDGTTYSGASFTSNVITSSGTVAVVMTVTDSRGRTASKTTNVTVQAYTPPKVTSVSAYRCTSSSSNTAKIDGGYICIKPLGNISAVSNKNTKTCTVYYKKSTATSYSSVALSMSDYVLDTEYKIITADINSSWDVYVTLADAFSTTTFYAPQVSSGGAYIHIPPDRSGMGLGKRRETSGYIETAWGFKANGDIIADADGRPISLQTAGTKLMNFYSARPSTLDVAPDGSGGMIKFLATSSSTGTNPTNIQGHVLHFFWDNTGKWDAQMLIQCNANPTVWVRGQSGGAFGTWRQLLDTTNFESLVMTSSSADVTMPTISGVTVTASMAKVSKTGKICQLAYIVTFKSTGSSSANIAANTAIGTIPTGYRPVAPIHAYVYGTSTASSYAVIGTDGTIKRNGAFNATTSGTLVSFELITYICA